MGGYVLMALLRRHPNRVRAVMLMSTKATPDTADGKRGRDEMIALAEAEGAGAVADRMLPKMLTARTRTEDPGLTEFVRSMMAATPVEGIVGALKALRDRPDSTSTLQGLQLPALILGGAEDEVAVPADLETMHRAIPGSSLEIVPEAAHLFNLEQPDVTNRTIRRFLEDTFRG
jgi:pimeloyl-ACP methyl ester carboxylesterase